MSITGQMAKDLVNNWGKDVVDEGNRLQQEQGVRWNENDWLMFRTSKVLQPSQAKKIKESDIKDTPPAYANKKEWELAKRIDQQSRLNNREKLLKEHFTETDQKIEQVKNALKARDEETESKTANDLENLKEQGYL